jgi:hypothetical protein
MLVIIPLLILSNTLYLQSECPPSGGGSWTNGSAENTFLFYGDQGSVNYQYRMTYGNNTEYDLQIDWTSMVNTSEFMSDEVLKKMLIEKAMLEIANLNKDDHDWEGSITFYYETDCTVQQKVAFNLITETEFGCCDDGGDPTRSWLRILRDQEDVIIENTLYLYKTIVCGQKCCKKTYYLGITYNSEAEEWQAYFIDNTPIAYEVTGCDCEIEYIDCEPPYDVIVPTGDCD